MAEALSPKTLPPAAFTDATNTPKEPRQSRSESYKASDLDPSRSASDVFAVPDVHGDSSDSEPDDGAAFLQRAPSMQVHDSDLENSSPNQKNNLEKPKLSMLMTAKSSGASEASDAAAPSRAPSKKTAVVSLLNGKQFTFECADGRNTATKDMHVLAMEKLQLPVEAHSAFALWMVSPSLQVQLKEHHMPFKVLKRWSELLSTFSYVSAFSELPMMYLKRDELFHQGRERLLTDPKCIRLLFEDMTFHVVYSFYPCNADEAAELAAIQLKIALFGNAEPPEKNDILDCEGCKMPGHLKMSSRKWRKAVLQAFDMLPQEPSTLEEWRNSYLALGRKWPYYGSTFFYGNIEPEEVKYTLRERPDVMVRVGVNLDGITVIKDKTNEIMLSLTYDELQYNSYDEDSGATEPSFLIEYDDVAAPDDDVDLLVDADPTRPPDGKSRLVIWTPQASMIDTLVSRHIDALSEWAEHLRQRKTERGKSYRPNVAGARGRVQGAADNNNLRKQFTLSAKFKSWRSKKWTPSSSGGSGTELSSLGSRSSSDTAAAQSAAGGPVVSTLQPTAF